MVSRIALRSAIAVAVTVFGLSVPAQDVPKPLGGWLDYPADVGMKTSPTSAWHQEHADVERNVGYNVSLAIDPKTGHKYISYYDGINGDLWLARTGAPVGNCGYQDTYHCQALDTGSVGGIGITGKYSSIAVGGPGTEARLYITYHDVSRFNLNLIEGSVNRQTGDFDYEIKILYEGEEDPDLLGDNEYAGKSSAVAIDDNGTPHVAFQYEDDSENKWGIYATKVPINTGNCGPEDDWQCDDLAAVFLFPDYISIGVDAHGLPKIAYYDERFAHGKLCIWNPSSGNFFDCLEVTGPNSGKYMSMFVEDDGAAHIAFHNETTEKLEYWIFRNGGVRYSTFIDSVGPYSEPAGISIAQDGLGFPVIAYQDEDPVSGDLDLKIARPLAATNWGAFGNCGPLNPSGFQTWLCETLRGGAPTAYQAYGGLSIAADGFGDLTVATRQLFGLTMGTLLAPREPTTGIFLDNFESGDTTLWSRTVP